MPADLKHFVHNVMFEHNFTHNALFQILAGFQLSGSAMLLEYLISIFCREPEHVHENAIQAAIVKFTRT